MKAISSELSSNVNNKYVINPFNKVKQPLQDTCCRVKKSTNFDVEFTFSKETGVNVYLKSGLLTIPIKSENLPTDLSKIKDSKVFNNVLDSSHVRVSRLSDGDYKVYINGNMLGGAPRYTRSDRETNKITAEALERAAFEVDEDGYYVNPKQVRSWWDRTWTWVKENSGTISNIFTVVSIVVGWVSNSCTIF